MGREPGFTYDEYVQWLRDKQAEGVVWTGAAAMVLRREQALQALRTPRVHYMRASRADS